MLKRILIYNVISILLGVFLYSLNLIIMDTSKLNFSLIGVYSFFTIAAILIITGLEILFENMPSTAGYAFLVCVFLKMGIFVLIFFAGGMAEKSLTLAEKFSILIPLFTFISLETYVVIKRLKF